MKEPYQCWPCNRIEWKKWPRKHQPKCSGCGREMDGPVSKSNCNVCGRELHTESEDATGLCVECG